MALRGTDTEWAGVGILKRFRLALDYEVHRDAVATGKCHVFYRDIGWL